MGSLLGLARGSGESLSQDVNLLRPMYRAALKLTRCSHERATLEKVNTLGLVYTIEGSDLSLKPTLLAAHQDVVPVPDASTWTHPPFAAVYDGEWLWGRGASDDKNSLTALMSAVETLLSHEDWEPKRTLILAFGFDEECSGYRGARAIGDFLTERYGDDGIAVILDEGGLGMQLVDLRLEMLIALHHLRLHFQQPRLRCRLGLIDLRLQCSNLLADPL